MGAAVAVGSIVAAAPTPARADIVCENALESVPWQKQRIYNHLAKKDDIREILSHVSDLNETAITFQRSVSGTVSFHFNNFPLQGVFNMILTEHGLGACYEPDERRLVIYDPNSADGRVLLEDAMGVSETPQSRTDAVVAELGETSSKERVIESIFVFRAEQLDEIAEARDQALTAEKAARTLSEQTTDVNALASAFMVAKAANETYLNLIEAHDVQFQMLVEKHGYSMDDIKAIAASRAAALSPEATQRTSAGDPMPSATSKTVPKSAPRTVRSETSKPDSIRETRSIEAVSARTDQTTERVPDAETGAPAAENASVDTGAAPKAAAASKTIDMTWNWKLQVISAENDQRFAVVEGERVTVGSRYQTYEVIEIGKRHVLMRSLDDPSTFARTQFRF